MKFVLCLSLLLSIPQAVLTYGINIPKTDSLELDNNTEGINKRGSENRIINGTEVEISEYSSAASFYVYEDLVSCTATFISKDVVLTAAHCLFNETMSVSLAKNIRIGGGTKLRVSESPKNYTVKKVLVHPSYDATTHYNDIALLFLLDAVLDPLISFAKIYNIPVADNTPVEVAGWGTTSADRSTGLSKVLEAAPIFISSSEDCSENSDNWVSNNGTTICTVTKNGKGACPGDSGGPLYYTGDSKKPIVGITSFNVHPTTSPITYCGAEGTTTYFTHVQKYIDWILKNTQIDAKDLVYKTMSNDMMPINMLLDRASFLIGNVPTQASIIADSIAQYALLSQRPVMGREPLVRQSGASGGSSR
ncbi:hypothetical protein BB558_003156 [Smittium angustum]|uniref:Peptidase S1 domain-containing protein n=1 Tax=Smittium angustum TaxID=133377 RepID=A0A2U1J6U8_SMIAN|nr:hypothetical protein BB558_003156 [Smittium angustum]